MMRALVSRIRQNDFLRAAYRHLFRGRVFSRLAVPEIRPVRTRWEETGVDRVNLLVPSINREHVFGGIDTALSLFDRIYEKTRHRAAFRLILTDADPDRQAVEVFQGYRTSVDGKGAFPGERQIVTLADRERSCLSVSGKDRFIATAWWTAYAVREILRRAGENGHPFPHPPAYLIQDFEPAFYNWSSHYALAESTYARDLRMIAIFNSSLLRDYFKEQGYAFFREYTFEPQLNPRLKEHLKEKQGDRKRQILFYGRPSVDRNGFYLIVEALRIWVELEKEPENWQLISIGELHPPVQIGKGLALSSVGKLSLEAYARYLCESALGVSLMLSPHPSYPPLEMAHFGVQTITNTFKNKDLSKLHDNIVSISTLSPYRLAEAMAEATRTFRVDPNKGVRARSRIPSYTEDLFPYPFINDWMAQWGL